MNRQPFYHRVTILFISTSGMDEHEFARTVLPKIAGRDIVKHSVQIESYEEPEAGDPADLL